MSTPSLSPAPNTPAGSSAAVQVPSSAADFVCAGRNVSTGQYIAGLMAAAQLETVGTPRKLPMDVFPDVDPGVVQEIWDRACVVAWRASQYAAAPRFFRDELTRLQGELGEAGFAAMGAMAGRSLRLVSADHPADSEVGVEREH